MSEKPTYEELLERVRELEKTASKYKQVEESITLAKVFLDRVIDMSPFAMWISDQEGTVIRTNRSLRETINLTDDKIIGKYNVFMDENLEALGVMPKVKAVFETHQSVRFTIPWKASQAGDVDFKDARDMHIDVSMFPILDAQNELMNVVCQWVDITDHKLAQEALRISEEYLFSILNSLADPICVKDTKHRWVLVNDRFCEISGVDREILLGKSDHDFFPEEEADVFWKMDEKVLRTGNENFSEETLTNATTGETIILNTKKTLYENHKGEKFIVAIGRDITDFRNLEANLQQAHKMEAIGTLAGGIAHDFNNILSPIIGNAELAMMDVDDNKSIQMNLKEILKAGYRAKDLVQQILTFSRQREQQKIPVKMSIIIKEISKLLRSTIPSTIDIRINLRAKVDTVLGDPTQIHQVIMNLCTNAFHAMREKGGLLRVELDDLSIESEAVDEFKDLKFGAYLRLSVTDSGHGIEPEIIDKIYDPYFTTKGLKEGTGMGLAVVLGIVHSLGGDIRVDSAIGEGSCFQVLLPKHEADMSGAEDADLIPSGTERILLVDDEKATIDVVKVMLERLGYKVVIRTSSTDALEAFRSRQDKFDLVITDMTMPNMTGKELAEELMTIRPNIPIILCTGFSDQIDEREANEMGIGAFVMKPIVMRDIANTIRDVLDKKK